MPLVILGLGIVLLFLLIIVLRLNAFLSLILSAIFVGVFQGMEPLTIVKSIETGLGGTLGHLAIIIGLGAIFGKIVSEGGGAHKIARSLINKFGEKRVGWAICLASFILGVILFFEVTFILLIPIVYTVAVEARVKLLKVGIPFLAAISITHCFLPPHPGPTAISSVLGANLGMVLVYGLILAIPASIIFGPLFSKLYDNWGIEVPSHLMTRLEFSMNEVPPFVVCVLTALSPVFLILIGVIAEYTLPKDTVIYKILTFIGNADISLLVSLFIAMYIFGLRKREKQLHS
ncbi:gluconate:H+ symporter [Geobacillus zalihae]|uniref:gluconate:H+ symporter n=1 Tax=Geobacillus zalihae TaxID=213419 RepID=UPI0021E0B90E|nr:gluconate:H+ symporter [Geobacillus zalihae]